MEEGKKLDPEQQALHDQFTAYYANAKADILLGKNLGKHFKSLEGMINAVNDRVDADALKGLRTVGFEQMGYWYYRLKEEAFEAFRNQK